MSNDEEDEQTDGTVLEEEPLEDEDGEAETEVKDEETEDEEVVEEVQINQIQFIDVVRPNNPNLPKNYYFDNDYVEQLLTEYVKGGCTDIKLRDKIMENASELIRQIIRTHKLHLITNGKDGTSFGDLYQLSWAQIESVLYKFDSRPGHTKVFNMWSQVAKTVMLAHIKKESRDKRNYSTYKEHLDSNTEVPVFRFERFIEEAKEIFKYDGDGLKLVDVIGKLFAEDDEPYNELIDKLITKSGMPKQKIMNFLRTIRLRSLEFTDSPLENRPMQNTSKHRVSHHGHEED